jgi:nucleoside 2-deoxyribosyltransferase
MLKIYLAGNVYETEYRKYVHETYYDTLNIFDPLQKIEAGIINIDFSKVFDKTLLFTNEEITKIVECDKNAIIQCDILVAYIKKPSFGTIMEILHSYNNQIPVYVINPEKTFINDVWLKYHTTRFFETIDECFNHILSALQPCFCMRDSSVFNGRANLY